MSAKISIAVVAALVSTLVTFVALAAFPGLRAFFSPPTPPPVPSVISFQGMLDSAGTPVTASKTMMFSIYPDSNSVSPEWSESQNVEVVDGIFDVYLGDATPIPDSIFDGSTLYLGIKVGADDEMAPRQRLGSVPYAFRSGVAACVESPEICDGLDNDCDGVADEDFPQLGGSCDSDDADLCENGIYACSGGAVACQGDINQVELCDGVDNTCDGVVDEGCECINGNQMSCYTGPVETQGVGECQDGIATCVSGAWDSCVGEVTPESEICNNHDDDCDGVTDEGNPGGGGACDTGLDGICSDGTEECQGGVLVCVQDNQAVPEICDDDLDNDCDGFIDLLDSDCTS